MLSHGGFLVLGAFMLTTVHLLDDGLGAPLSKTLASVVAGRNLSDRIARWAEKWAVMGSREAKGPGQS